MRKDSGEGIRDGALLEEERPPSVSGLSPASRGEDDPAYSQPWREKLRARVPQKAEPSIPPTPTRLPEKEEEHSQAGGVSGGESRKSFLRRRSIASALAAILMAAAIGAGYVYWD